MRSPRFSLDGILLVLATLMIQTGCSSWRSVQVPPPQDLSSPELRVTTSDARVVLKDARVSGDSVVGSASPRAPSDWNGSPHPTASVPISSISKLESRHTDVFRSIGLAAILAPAVALGIAYADMHSR